MIELARVAAGDGFYAGVARATSALLDLLAATLDGPAPPPGDPPRATTAETPTRNP